MMYEPALNDEAEEDPYAYSQLEQTQRATQSQQDGAEEWDDKLWGALKPVHHALSRIRLDKNAQSITLGRASDNDVILSNLKISNKHCVLSWDGNQSKDSNVIVLDKSSNGTWIDGHKIGRGKSALLKDGSDIAFGQWSQQNSAENYRYIFRFMADGPPLQSLYQSYDVGNELGRGSFATVKRAVCREDGRPYALKMINRKKLGAEGEKAASVFLREIAILEQLHHPNICQLKESFQETADVVLVLEFIDGGDLLDYIIARNGINEEETRRFAFQLCKALKYIHARGIAHRDLKPENILLTRDDPPILKIADFGLAKAVDSLTRFKTMCGTPIYLAPEVILRDAQESYSHVVDSWSAGVIVFAMIANCSPFVDDEASVIAIRFRSRYIDWSLLESKGVSGECRSFIERLIEENPAERMTCADALKHPWLAPLSANDPEALSEIPNDSFISVRANAGSFTEEVLTTPEQAEQTPLPAVPQISPDLPSTGISGDFEHIRMEDGEISPASTITTTVLEPEPEPEPELELEPEPEPEPEPESEHGPAASSQGLGRKLVRHPMQVAEVDENGRLTSFHAFTERPSEDAGPSNIGNSNGNSRGLKRKERSDSLMEDNFELVGSASEDWEGTDEGEGVFESDSSLTPIPEDEDTVPDNGPSLRSANARKKSVAAPAPQQEDATMLGRTPAKRTRSMPANVAA